ncbi:MAG: hypothetical protein ACTSWW_02005 [Promethearchaeota archaeon]
MDREIGVHCDAKARAFLAKQKRTEFLLDVEFTEEPCVQIHSPVFRLFIENPEKFHTVVRTEDITLFFSPSFLDVFALPSTLNVSVEGLLRKHLIVKNVDPIIKNICKI